MFERGLLNVSNPKMTIMDTLSKLSHDADPEVAQGAILALGLIGAGSNNARIAQLLRQLSSYYDKEANHLFMVRIAQGLLFMGKGLISLSPFYSDRSLTCAMYSRMLLTVDDDLNPIPVSVRVGTAVEPGRPKTITGVQTLRQLLCSMTIVQNWLLRNILHCLQSWEVLSSYEKTQIGKLKTINNS